METLLIHHLTEKGMAGQEEIPRPAKGNAI
jgi:hypothetical protein